MNNGLALQMVQQEMGNTIPMTLEQVVEALLNGADPEELLRQGVPVELLKQAAELILSQSQSNSSTQTPVASEGLANKLIQ